MFKNKQTFLGLLKDKGITSVFWISLFAFILIVGNVLNYIL
ncbi:hypothetical protein IGI96_003752 [Enterococcus sp. DIV0421]